MNKFFYILLIGVVMTLGLFSKPSSALAIPCSFNQYLICLDDGVTQVGRIMNANYNASCSVSFAQNNICGDDNGKTCTASTAVPSGNYSYDSYTCRNFGGSSRLWFESPDDEGKVDMFTPSNGYVTTLSYYGCTCDCNTSSGGSTCGSGSYHGSDYYGFIGEGYRANLEISNDCWSNGDAYATWGAGGAWIEGSYDFVTCCSAGYTPSASGVCEPNTPPVTEGFCGDGVIDLGLGEVCELNNSQTVSCGDVGGICEGSQTQNCATDCKSWVNSGSCSSSSKTSTVCYDEGWVSSSQCTESRVAKYCGNNGFCGDVITESRNKADGTVCSDGNTCTSSDVCQGGSCAGSVSGTHAECQYGSPVCSSVSNTIDNCTNRCTLSASCSGLVCSPSSQTKETGQSVSVTSVGGDAGTYTWSAPGGSPSSSVNGVGFTTTYSTSGNKTITVTNNGNSATCSVLVVTPVPTPTSTTAPIISLSPTSFTFNAVSGGATPSDQLLTIGNTGTATLNWAFSRTGTDTWCNLSTTSGSIATGGSLGVYVSVLGPSNIGSFTNCGIRISDANDATNYKNATITYNVSASPTPTPTPTCSPSSQSTQTNQNVSLSATGGDGTYSWAASGGTPSSGTSANFTTKYSSSGSKNITVTSGGVTSTACTVSVAVPLYNHARCDGITAPATANTGDSFSASIAMTNDGTKDWTTANNYNLGSQNTQDNQRWGTGRVGLPSSTIAVGQPATFSRIFTAPSDPSANSCTSTGGGNYSCPFEWKMVQDGVEWFDQGCTGVLGKTITVHVNQGPSTVPTVNGTGFEPNYCSGLYATLQWSYSDPEGDPQSAYQVQVDDSSDFSSPLYDSGKVTGTTNILTLSTGLIFNSSLKARVMAWDSNDNPSAWGVSNTWTTPNHAYPNVNFSWSPSQPTAKIAIRFNDLTTFYDGGGTRIWAWLFGDGTSSSQQTPSKTYTDAGVYSVSLTATDKDGYSCPITQTVNVSRPLPTWNEVSPK